MALNLFSTQTFNPRVIASKAADYTVLTTDEQVTMTGATARTFTLPALDSLRGTMLGGTKVYSFINSGTANLTIQPGTSGITGTADTIAKSAVYTVKPNETLLISGHSSLTDWGIGSPMSVPAMGRNTFTVTLNTSGTTPQNIIGASGAPVNLTVTAVLLVALDTNAGNVKVKNGTSVINDSTGGTAKSATAGIVTGAVALTTTAVAAGAVFTVESDSTNGNATVIIVGTTQSIIQ